MLAQEHVFILAMELIFNLFVDKKISLLRIVFSEITRLLNHLMAITTHALDVWFLKVIFTFGL